MGIKLTGFDELLEKLDKLSDKGRVDEIAKKAVEAARGTVESSVCGAIASSSMIMQLSQKFGTLFSLSHGFILTGRSDSPFS